MTKNEKIYKSSLAIPNALLVSFHFFHSFWPIHCRTPPPPLRFPFHRFHRIQFRCLHQPWFAGRILDVCCTFYRLFKIQFPELNFSSFSFLRTLIFNHKPSSFERLANSQPGIPTHNFPHLATIDAHLRFIYAATKPVAWLPICGQILRPITTVRAESSALSSFYPSPPPQKNGY